MKIFSQWRVRGDTWSFAPFSVFHTGDFFGVVILNFLFEWAITPAARHVHDCGTILRGR